ncbi:hypothetical protein Tco_0758374 [Tanacetum coccineum]
MRRLRSRVCCHSCRGRRLDYAYGETLFQVLGMYRQFQDYSCCVNKLECDALSWWKAHLSTQDLKQARYEREYGSICHWIEEIFGEYMERFTRLASFVGATTAGPTGEHIEHRVVMTRVSMSIGVVSRTRVLSIGVVSIGVMIRNDMIFGVRIKGLLVRMGMTARVRSEEVYRDFASSTLLSLPWDASSCICYKATGGMLSTCGSTTQHLVKGLSPTRSRKTENVLPAVLLRLPHDTGGLCYRIVIRRPDFRTVFVKSLSFLPVELPGNSSRLLRGIELELSYIPGDDLISKARIVYMAPVELKELKEQLHEMLENGFIRPSVSPWGAPVLFVKKKEGAYAGVLITANSTVITIDFVEKNRIFLRHAFRSVMAIRVLGFALRLTNALSRVYGFDEPWTFIMEPSKVEATTKWPETYYVTEVERLLGLLAIIDVLRSFRIDNGGLVSASDIDFPSGSGGFQIYSEASIWMLSYVYGVLVAFGRNVEDGKHTEFSVDDDGVVWFEDRLCVPNDQALREKVMTEAHSSPFTIHPG